MKTLLTGASGFIGRNLLAHLKETAAEGPLFSMGRRPLQVAGVTHFQADLTDLAEVKRVLAEVTPDRIFHLAGGSRVASEIPFLNYFESNFLTTARLVEALEPLARLPSLFFSSSVHVYGNRSEPVTEESPPRPINPYGFSKYLAEQALQRFGARRPDARLVVARLYSCIGPGQAEGFVVSDLCRRLAKLPNGSAGVLETGPLDAFRRFVDVRDAVCFFPWLLQGASPGFHCYNLASPHEMQIHQLVTSLISISGKSPRVESSSAKSTNPFLGLRLSPEKLLAAAPQLHFRPFEETLRDTYRWTCGE